jgi:hypothetical protein
MPRCLPPTFSADFVAQPYWTAARRGRCYAAGICARVAYLLREGRAVYKPKAEMSRYGIQLDYTCSFVVLRIRLFLYLDGLAENVFQMQEMRALVWQRYGSRTAYARCTIP